MDVFNYSIDNDLLIVSLADSSLDLRFIGEKINDLLAKIKSFQYSSCIFDISRAEIIDSIAIGVLVKMQKEIGKSHFHVVVSEDMFQIFRKGKVTEFMNVYQLVDDAKFKI